MYGCKVLKVIDPLILGSSGVGVNCESGDLFKGKTAVFLKILVRSI